MSTIYYVNIDVFLSDDPPPFPEKINNRHVIIMDPGRFSQYLIQFYSFVQFHQVKKKPNPKKHYGINLIKKEKK